MKKFFSFIFVILVLIILLLWVFKAQLVSYVISKESGVDVRIESVSLSLNGFRAKNIVAHDPKSATTLSFGLVDVKTDLLKIFRDVVTINNLKLDDVTIKSDPGKIDLSQFGGLFQRKNSSPKKSSRSGQRYVIEATEASNVQIQVENPLSDRLLLKATIPTVRLSKINQGQPLTLKQVLDFLTNQFQSLNTIN